MFHRFPRIPANSRLALALPLAFLASLLPLSSRAVTIDLFPSSDNTLFESVTPFDFGSAEANRSNGSGPYLFTGRTFQNGTGLLRRGLISFDVSGSLPSGSIITGANLRLYVSKTISGNTDVALHRVTTAWGEGSSDSGSPGGAGAAAMPGDATWLHTHFDTDNWSNPGGDFDSLASAVTAVGSESLFYAWTGSGLVSDLQFWLQNPGQNFGWILIGDEANAGSAKRFDSRESFDFDFVTGDPTLPLLSIEYSVIPEPSTNLLLLSGCAVLLLSNSRRRR